MAVFLLISCVCSAQATKAELLGIVTDPAGGFVAGVRVVAQHLATGERRQAVTGPEGSFQFAGLVPGEYRLTAEGDGWATQRRDGLALRVGDRIAISLQMSVGEVVQVVDVTASAPLLQSSRGGVSMVVEQQKVVTLPLDGRNFVPLIALSPGVSLPPGSALPRINGSRPRVSEYIYDGISVLQPEPGQVAFYPVIDAIEEFRVEVNGYSAEYGRSNGGVIMVRQKSGGNELHGTLFEFFRNEKLNARNLFANTGPKPVFRRNQYGAAVGGPLKKNKLFFFADWQGARLNTGVVRVSTVPLAAEREGKFAAPVFDPATTQFTSTGYRRDPFAGNMIPESRWDAGVRPLLNRYPRANVFSGGREAAANNYRRTGNERTAQDQLDGRVDWLAGAAHRFMGRFTEVRDEASPLTPLDDGSGRIASGVTGLTFTRAWSYSGEHTWTISPSAVNQLRAGHTGRGFERSSLALPVYDLVGFQQLGPSASSRGEVATSVTQVLDTLAIARGRHSIKAGLDFRRQRLNVFQPPNPLGATQFTAIGTGALTATGTAVSGTGSALASFLLGQVQRYTSDVQEAMIRPRASILEAFVQSDWQASRNLTLNAGLRHTLNFPSTVLDNRGGVFDLSRQRLSLLGVDGFPRNARNLEKGNIAPRLGLAYKLNDQLVVRAGYGMTWIEQAGITTPFTTPFFPFIQTLTQESLDNINPAFVLSRGPGVQPAPPGPDAGLGQGVFGVQRDNGSGYAQQWNMTLQRTFGDLWSLEAGYLGSKLTRLGVPDVNLNQLPVEQLALGPALTQSVANPYFGEIPLNSPLGRPQIARNQLLRAYPRFTTVALYRNNVGHSTYHGGQVHLTRQFGRGLTLTAAYTFSKLIDDAGAVFDSALLTGPVANYQVADSFNKRLEKDISTGHVPHIFTSGFVYELPFRGTWLGGWRVAGIVRAQAGSPVAVIQGTNLNAFAGFGIQRPNLVREAGLLAEERSVGRWFDTGAFTAAPQFRLGNSNRNPVVGPGFRTVDIMVGKTWAWKERYNLELRGEAFNATNTPPLGSPNGLFGTPAFGSITTALDPRVFELVLKLSF